MTSSRIKGFVGADLATGKSKSKQQYLITCEGLKGLFPQHAKEIAQLDTSRKVIMKLSQLAHILILQAKWAG